MKYELEDNLPLRENVLYSFQQVVLFVASAVVMPVIVGYTIGLQQIEVAAMLQRTFFLCGVMTLLQVNWGHKFPIQDGPAGLWSGLFIIMAGTLPALGTSLSVLRTDLEMGMMISGGIVVLICATGLINIISKLFTPIINGLLILLMVLQISSSIIKGMLGVSDKHSNLDAKSILVAVFTMVVILIINSKMKGFIRSIATFIGMIAGWILAAVLGIVTKSVINSDSLISLPKPFAWGTPTFDAGVVVTCIIGSIVLLSMAFASINGMGETVGEKITEEKIKKTIGFHGLATMLTGVFASIAFMPYVSSIGVVQMTGVAARKQMHLASFCMILMGLVAPFGVLFSTIPAPVGNGALIMIFALCIGQALKEFNKVTFENRENLIVGLSIIVGVGMMFIPSSTFSGLPVVIACILSNGLIVGMLFAFLMEHIILKKEPESKGE